MSKQKQKIVFNEDSCPNEIRINLAYDFFPEFDTYNSRLLQDSIESILESMKTEKISFLKAFEKQYRKLDSERNKNALKFLTEELNINKHVPVTPKVEE